MKIIRASEHRIMPWKNGGGTTREILTIPDKAGIDDFTLRLSIAHVATDGPFSRFDGVSRSLTVIEGGPMRLSFEDGETVELRSDSDPFAFSGERPVIATIAAPLSDFNIMIRAPHAIRAVRRAELNTAPALVADGGPAFALVLENATLSGPDGLFDLGPLDLVCLERDEAATLSGLAGSAVLATIT